MSDETADRAGDTVHPGNDPRGLPCSQLNTACDGRPHLADPGGRVFRVAYDDDPLVGELRHLMSQPADRMSFDNVGAPWVEPQWPKDPIRALRVVLWVAIVETVILGVLLGLWWAGVFS